MRLTLTILLGLMLASCAGKGELAKYEKDIEEIRQEVRTIRVMTDDMKAELGSLRNSMESVDESVKTQTADIEKQREHQARLKEIVGSIKDAVVKLESENLPAQKERLEQFRNENTDDMSPDDGFVVKTEQVGDMTMVYAEKSPEPVQVKPKQTFVKDIDVKETKNAFGYAVKDGVILWQYPAKNSDVLEILVSWQQLNILGKVQNGGTTWWKVKTNDYTGYVDSRYVIISE